MAPPAPSSSSSKAASRSSASWPLSDNPYEGAPGGDFAPPLPDDGYGGAGGGMPFGDGGFGPDTDPGGF